MTCEDVAGLVDAYADGELALESALALETHVAVCPTCAARLEQIRAVKNALRTAPYFRAPEALTARVRATTAATATAGNMSLSRPSPVRPLYRRWQPWLTAAAGLALISLTAFGIARQRAALATDATAVAVTESHVRSLMADHLTDVASTDRHTVKPWFAGRLDFSPVVVDLASEGFPLVGGRLDYIDHHSAAALVYKRREHTINVFLWPQADGSQSHTSRNDARGYHIVFWSRDGMAVWIVSDLASVELDDFARKLDEAMHQ